MLKNVATKLIGMNTNPKTVTLDRDLESASDFLVPIIVISVDIKSVYLSAYAWYV